MIAAAEAVPEAVVAAAQAAGHPRFVLLDAGPELAQAVQNVLTKPLGFEPEVLALPEGVASAAGLLRGGVGEAFLLPVDLEFGLFAKETLTSVTADLRRAAPGLEVCYDDVSLSHPLLVEAFSEAALQACGDGNVRERRGLLMVASGEGDPASRAGVYGLMRNVWERVAATRGEVAFLRHATPFLRGELERVSREPLEWIVVPAMLERGERFEHLELILADQLRNEPGAAFRLARPPGNHPAIVHWLAQRALDLWRSKRQAEGLRARSAKSRTLAPARQCVARE
ncbi:MAG: hypothetical protein HKN10_16185, partial [Myxococcales bacterium]|nr:hypothetical protein [Myxococcales bacterium]